jgi:hypothetical protein
VKEITMAWAYIAAAAGVPMAETFALATEKHLIVRAFYRQTAVPAALGRARNLAPGDILVLLYVNRGTIEGALRCILVDAADVGLVRLSEYPELAALHPVIANDEGIIPNCFGVAEDGSQQAQAIVQAGYGDNRRDAQIGKWVVMTVKDTARIDQIPAQWQAWRDDLPDPQTPLHVFPEDLVQIGVAEPVEQPEPQDDTNAQTVPSGETSESIPSPDQAPRSEAQASGPSRCTPDVASPHAKPGVSFPVPARSPLRLFDVYIFVDWSGAARPGKEGDDNTIWYAVADGQTPPHAHFCATRQDCTEALEKLLQELVQKRKRVLIGFDFPYGYPRRFATALGLTENAPPWLSIWNHLEAQIEDGSKNDNNRWTVAAAMNAMVAPHDLPGPFWGCLKQIAAQYPLLQMTQPDFPYCEYALPKLRITEKRFPGVQATWQLFFAGSVGSQTLLGIPRLRQLRFHPELVHFSSVWPFETGFVKPVGRGRCPWILHAEIWPGLVRLEAAALEEAHPDWPQDRAQVVAMCHWAIKKDQQGELADYFQEPPGLTEDEVVAVVNEEGWILGTPKP